jgi:hypothetical protein
MPNNDATGGRNQLLFPLEDAERALNNSLQDKGFNIYAANPFTRSLQRSARGLRQSFIQDRALGTGYNPGTAPSEDFGSYLSNALGSGNVYANLERAAMQMPDAARAIRANQNAIASGDSRQVNPYMQLLGDEMSANDGQGTANALTYLRAPIYGTQIGRAYSDMLGDVVSSANRQLANDPQTYQPGGGRDFWSYIFGGNGSPF